MKYRKKPVVIEAFRLGYDPTPRWFLDKITGWEKAAPSNWRDTPSYITIQTLEGPHYANVGDYIIKGIQGELYPCKPDIFEATYEKVEEV